MLCNICRKECDGHRQPMVLVRCNGESISRATEREPLCLIDYCVCDDCAKSWQQAYIKRQTMPIAMLLIVAAICIVVGLSTKIGWGMYVVAAVPILLIGLSVVNIFRHLRRTDDEKKRMVFCDFFFQKGGIPKQIIARMPYNHTVQNVLVAARGPDRYMLMDLDEMDRYLTDEEKRSTRSWKKAPEN